MVAVKDVIGFNSEAKEEKVAGIMEINSIHFKF